MSNFAKQLLGGVIEGLLVFAFIMFVAFFMLDAEPTGRNIATLLVVVPITAGISGLVKTIVNLFKKSE